MRAKLSVPLDNFRSLLLDLAGNFRTQLTYYGTILPFVFIILTELITRTDNNIFRSGLRTFSPRDLQTQPRRPFRVYLPLRQFQVGWTFATPR